MEFFSNVKAVRLRSHNDKFLTAAEDKESVCQERNGTSRARWTVELVDGGRAVRLKSIYGRYLTASNEPFLLGMTGRKVLQTLPTRRLDSSVEWEPLRDGFQVRLKTHYGQFLRANGGPPPWRNSVTHDIPHRSATQNWVFWEVEVVEILVHPSQPADSAASPAAATPPWSSPDASDSGSSSPTSTPQAKRSLNMSRFESSSFSGSPRKPDGRTIRYRIADDAGAVEEGFEGMVHQFKGTSVEELTRQLEEEVGRSDLIVCSRNPLNGKLHPLRLRLPPNNSPMSVVLVSCSSTVAKGFRK